MKTVVCFTAVLGLLLTAAQADWPTWRGAQRDGICQDTGLIGSFSDKGPPLLWKIEGLGKGMASIAHVDGKLFTMGRNAGETRLLCYDSATQKQVWSLTTAKKGDEPNSTPTVADGRVYSLDRAGNVTCADVVSGKELWQKNLESDFGGKMESSWGWSESPTVDGGIVIVTPGSEKALLVALDSKTGKTVWQTTAPDLGNKGNDGAAYSSIVVSHAGGRKQYVQLTGRAVVGVDAKDGRLLWHYNAVNNGTANIPTPLIWDNHVFVSTGYGAGAALLEIKPDGAGLKAVEVYLLPAKTFQNHHGGMVLKDGFIYAGSGHNNGFPICLEAKTGKVMWGEERHSAGKESAALVYADGHLFFRYQNGIMAMVSANPKQYQEQGNFKLAHVDGPSWPHPVIDGGILYVRSQDVLMAYDVRAKR